MLIALTGGSGCGKSIVARAAEDLGCAVIYTDRIGHSIILRGNSAYNEIAEFFGNGILKADGEIDRKKLGAVVFCNKEKLDILNKITHNKIIEEIQRLLQTPSSKLKTVIDGAVLHQTPLLAECDTVIAVSCDTDKRISRITARDGITEEAAKKRIASQLTDKQYRTLADIVIDNNGSEAELYDKAREVIHNIGKE